MTEQRAPRRPQSSGTTGVPNDVRGHALAAVPVGTILTHRELQVLELVSHGMRNREIGERLGISEQTVKNHMWSVLRRLSLPDRTRAAVVAIARGWIPAAEGADLRMPARTAKA
ncbi:MAG: LuxR C-terminal-related transcriptional regulator [Chloroflexota bacterium]